MASAAPVASASTPAGSVTASPPGASIAAEAADICGRGLYIGGTWVQPVRGGTVPVVDPATEEVLCQCPAGSPEDVDKAVAAAKAAFATWGMTTGAERAVHLRAIAKAVRDNKDQLSRLEAVDAGKPLGEAEWDIDDVAGCFDYYAGLAEKLDTTNTKKVDVGDDDYVATIRYEPIGVIGAVVPWNYPLLMATWKVAAALAAGCTVVLKPSEVTPITANLFGQLCMDVKLPAGVLNIVQGTGVQTGAPIVGHKDVNKVAFTGSVATGSRVMAKCAESVRGLSLELGGKSAALLFDDAKFDNALEWIMFGIFWTNGQICSATSRLLVQEGIADKFVKRLAEEAAKLRVGAPLDPTSQMGPLVNKTQYDKVMAYIDNAQKQGATLLTGGTRPAGKDKGYYVTPTVLTDVTDDMDIWKEEVFGPVLCIRTFKTEEEGLEMANNSDYGLAAAVFTADKDRMQRVTRALEVGIVWNNCSQPCFCQMPWGGMKASGFGRDLGEEGLHKYLQAKSITEHVAGNGVQWYFKTDSKL